MTLTILKHRKRLCFEKVLTSAFVEARERASLRANTIANFSIKEKLVTGDAAVFINHGPLARYCQSQMGENTYQTALRYGSMDDNGLWHWNSPADMPRPELAIHLAGALAFRSVLQQKLDIPVELAIKTPNMAAWERMVPEVRAIGCR